MDMETYKKRSEPRLRSIEQLDKRCQWDKMESELPFSVIELRDRRKRLMDEQTRDEIDAGL